ncbi:MAG: M48 family metalloprotease [Rickettsiaceae bacterium]|nr:M48 family metalloprotease [Rickettsiaceae bacterium]
MKIFTKYLCILWLTIISYSAFAIQIIDAEVESAISSIAEPIIKASNVKDVKISVILERSPNAFATHGNNIILNSALIGMFPDPSVLRGVIAHEIGHIKAGHIIKMENKLQYSNLLLATSVLLSLATTILIPSNSMDGDRLIAPYMLGSHMLERSILQFSRENEYVADTAAQSFLNKAGYSDEGLVNLLKYFQSHSNITGEARYDITHPLSAERISNLQMHNKVSNYLQEDNKISFMYKMASAKLASVTNISSKSIKRDEDAERYFEIHKLERGGRILEATKEIDILIKKYPNYPFFLQKKAELLLSAGSKDALTYYEKAIAIHNSKILKIEKSIAQIVLSNDKNKIAESISILEIGAGSFGNNSTIMNYLAIAYDKIGNKAMSIYYRALREFWFGDKTKAKSLAKMAKMHAGNSSSILEKINDIINEER